MCGIAGWLNAIGTPANHQQIVVGHMLDAIAHRGPDDRGLETIGNVTLGHVRLTILDLSPRGKQPMVDGNHGTWITFNGEIYNYTDLKKSLSKSGVRFHSTSDTEVLLKHYSQNPQRFLDAVEGMFAFALLDTQRNQLILARDRLGEKPLYYTHKPGQSFGFASEPAGLLANPLVTRDIHPQGVRAYLQFGFVPAPMTAFAEIKALPPGHIAVLDTRTAQWKLPPTPYWDFHRAKRDTPSSGLSSEPTTVLENVTQEMRRSIAGCLQADVPVGVLLSGGLDSSTVCALTREIIGPRERLHTFHVGFDIAAMNEQEKAGTVAKVLGTLHHEFICTHETFLEALPGVLDTIDNPLAEHLLPMHFVAKLAREHVTVVLSGDGADEVLGGYNSYKHVLKLQRLLQNPLAKELLYLGAPLIERFHPKPASKRQWHRVNQFLGARRSVAYLAYRHSGSPGEQLEGLFEADSPLGQLIRHSADPMLTMLELLPTPTDSLNTLDDFLMVDAVTTMAEGILMKSDRMTMRHGLELRSPFLNHHVMQYLYGLPDSFKLQYGQSKWLLRAYLKQRLPESIWNQQKAGFSAPLSHWLRERPEFYGEFSLIMMDYQAKTPTLGICDQTLDGWLEQHKRGKADHAGKLWNLLILMAWAYNTLERPLSKKTIPTPSLETHNTGL